MYVLLLALAASNYAILIDDLQSMQRTRRPEQHTFDICYVQNRIATNRRFNLAIHCRPPLGRANYPSHFGRIRPSDSVQDVRRFIMRAASNRDDPSLYESLPIEDTDDSWYGELLGSTPAKNQTSVRAKSVQPMRQKSSSPAVPSKSPLIDDVPKNTNTIPSPPEATEQPKLKKKRGKLLLLKPRDMAYKILQQREAGEGDDFIENIFERSVSKSMASEDRGLCQELVLQWRLLAAFAFARVIVLSLSRRGAAGVRLRPMARHPRLAGRAEDEGPQVRLAPAGRALLCCSLAPKPARVDRAAGLPAVPRPARRPSSLSARRSSDLRLSACAAGRALLSRALARKAPPGSWPLGPCAG